MADDQTLSPKDLQELREIASQLPTGHPAQKKVALLLNSQPTQFEQERSGGEGLLGTVLNKAKGLIPQDPTGGRSLLDPKAWYNPDEAKFSPSSSPFVTQATRPIPQDLPGNRAIYRGASMLSPLVPGLDPQAMEQASAKGDVGGVAAEAAVPAAMTAVPELIKGAGRARAAIGTSIHDPLTGRMTPGARAVGRAAGMAVGGGAGALLGGTSSLLAGGIEHGGGALGLGYLGARTGEMVGPSMMEKMFPNPNPPGPFSKIPMRMPGGGSSDAARSVTDASSAFSLTPEPGKPMPNANPDFFKPVVASEAEYKAEIARDKANQYLSSLRGREHAARGATGKQ